MMPSMELFRHYFVPHLGYSKWIAGGVTFHLRRSVAHQYPELKLKSCWGEWRHNWYLISEENLSPHLLLPLSPAEHLANSKEVSSQDPTHLPIIERITKLRQKKLMCTAIASDFIWRGIAPLQRRPQPLWEIRQKMGLLLPWKKWGRAFSS